MSKKMLQSLYPQAKVKRILFGDYNYSMEYEDTIYHILVLNVNHNSILSINSKHIWEIKQGKANGANFKTTSKALINISKFNQLSNKIVVLKNKPHKILKYLNESDVVDISNEKNINGIKIYNSMKEILV